MARGGTIGTVSYRSTSDLGDSPLCIVEMVRSLGSQMATRSGRYHALYRDESTDKIQVESVDDYRDLTHNRSRFFRSVVRSRSCSLLRCHGAPNRCGRTPKTNLQFAFPDDVVWDELDRQGIALPNGMKLVDLIIEFSDESSWSKSRSVCLQGATTATRLIFHQVTHGRDI